MKHKYYDIIVAWATGKTVQYKFEGIDWRDFYSDNRYSFDDEEIEWRIKPTGNNTLRYRNALMKCDDADYYIETISSSKNSAYSIEEQRNMVETDVCFVCWVDDYKDFYVER